MLFRSVLTIWHRHVDKHLAKAMTKPRLLAAKKSEQGQSCSDVNVTKQTQVANELTMELMMSAIEVDDIESVKVGLQKLDGLETEVDEKVRTTIVKLQKLRVEQPELIHEVVAMFKDGAILSAKACNFQNLPEQEDRK